MTGFLSRPWNLWFHVVVVQNLAVTVKAVVDAPVQQMEEPLAQIFKQFIGVSVPQKGRENRDDSTVFFKGQGQLLSVEQIDH